MSEPLMVELVPGAWVRPDQVAAIWNESDEVMSVQFVGGGDMRRFHKDAPLAEIIARLAPRWEQPPGTVMYADTSGAPRTGYERQISDPPPDDGDTIEIRSMSGEVRRVVPGVLPSRPTSEWAMAQAVRGGLQWGATTGDREATDL